MDKSNFKEESKEKDNKNIVERIEESIKKRNREESKEIKREIKEKEIKQEELEEIENIIERNTINEGNKEIYEELIKIPKIQQYIIKNIIKEIEINYELYDQFNITLTEESIKEICNDIIKEKGNENKIIQLLKLLSKWEFESLNEEEKNCIKNCIIQSNNKLIIQIGCSILRKDQNNINYFVDLMNIGNDFVAETAADNLFAECLDDNVLNTLRRSILNNMPPVCERVQDIIISVLQANNPKMKDIEKIKIALELSRYNHLHDLRKYIIHIVLEEKTPLNEIIQCCFEVLSKKLNYQIDLVESIRFILERLIPFNQQLNPRRMQLKYNNNFIIVYCRQTAEELIKQLNKNGVVVAFGDVIPKNTALEDVGLKEGDEIMIDENVEYETTITNTIKFIDITKIENDVTQLINGNINGKLQILEVLPFIKQKFEPNYIPYKYYNYYKQQNDIELLHEELLLFDINDINNKDTLEVYCKLLTLLSNDICKTIIETKCEEIINENGMKFIQQLFITPELHYIIPNELWKWVNKIVNKLQGNEKHSFCFNAVKLYKDNHEFINEVIKMKDIVLVSMLLNQNPTPYIIEQCKNVFNLFKDNTQRQKELKQFNELDYYYSIIQYYSPNPNEVIEYINQTISTRRRWILLTSLKTIHNINEIVKINNTISYEGINEFDFSGFYNPSKLCYMTSVLVQLLSIEEFQTILRQTSCKSRVILLLISALKYFTKNGEEFKIENLLLELQKYTKMELNEFNDVSEFMMLLWDVLEKELPEEEFKQLEKHFIFQTKNKTSEGIQEDKHLFLIIPFGVKSIEEYIIERNDELQTIEEYPDYLQIQFQRSLYNSNKTQWKNNDEISFGYSIKLPLNNGEKENYILKGIIVHFGTVNIGHYISYILNPENNIDWIYFNDDKVEKISWYNFNIQQKCFGKKDKNEYISTAYILIYQKQSKLNKNINQIFHFVEETHPFDIPLPNVMVDKFFSFSLQSNLKLQDIRILHYLKNYMFDITNYQIVTKMIKLLTSESDIVRKTVLQMFLNYHKSVKHIDFRFIDVIVHYVSSFYSMFYPSPSIHLKEFITYLNVFCEGDDVEINSFRRIIIIYATKSLSLLNLMSRSTIEEGLEKLFYHLVSISHPTIQDIDKDNQIMRWVLTTDGGSKIIKELYNGMFLKLVFIIKKCFACDEEEMYLDLFKMILTSNDKKAIFSLLSIYSEFNRSSINKPLPEAYCYGLLTLIEPTRHGMNVIQLILSIKNPLITECLDKMYGSYDLFKTTIRKYAHSLDSSLDTFEDSKLKMYELGYSDVYDECAKH
ncbi:ubiquitin carboxylterminal hydrolase domain containing protein [Entamoeba histolytica KU27]|uniref:Ubiquitin carboxylterminal hydrolase domain containing protein n=1 Tax=Entamoeba histolytica KU27 TaxID=885311 RepID=M2R7M0_ENTHI|nr:ubiquitin carboxylterminal hydrolase domain containing protein [Entamoeba histolytica KU27]